MGIVEEKRIIKGIPVLICKTDEPCKKPLVIASHGFTGSKEYFKKKGYLKELAESGYYAVAIDNRLHGDRPGPGFRKIIISSLGKIDLLLLRKVIKETADDVKLLIDELSAIEEVLQDEIAMVGISMGGFVTHRAIVADDRIKAAVPIISSPYWDDIPGDISVVANDDLKLYSKEYQPSEHLNKYFPTALLMQVGDQDKHYDVDKIKGFYKELKKFYPDSPDKLKLIIYPDTKHEVRQEMWEQSIKWLKDNL